MKNCKNCKGEEVIPISDLIRLINQIGYNGVTSMGTTAFVNKDRLIESIHNYQDIILITPQEEKALDNLSKEILNAFKEDQEKLNKKIKETEEELKKINWVKE